MFYFDIEKWVPDFILADKNGYAVARAIGAALEYMNDITAEAAALISDYTTMPEWRLDELAWEYGIPYDYTADIEIKRAWIRDALTLSRLYGTPEGVRRYMSGYFGDAAVEEAFNYGGDEYHFRLVLSGRWTPENIAWISKTLSTVKNVRSVLDGCSFTMKWLQGLYAGCAMYGRGSGTYLLPPLVIEEDWYIDEDGNMLLDENGIVLIVEG